MKIGLKILATYIIVINSLFVVVRTESGWLWSVAAVIFTLSSGWLLNLAFSLKIEK